MSQVRLENLVDLEIAVDLSDLLQLTGGSEVEEMSLDGGVGKKMMEEGRLRWREEEDRGEGGGRDGNVVTVHARQIATLIVS